MEPKKEELTLKINKNEANNKKKGFFSREFLEKNKNKLFLGVAGGILAISIFGFEGILSSKNESDHNDSIGATPSSSVSLTFEEENDNIEYDAVASSDELNIEVFDRGVPFDMKPSDGTIICMVADEFVDGEVMQDASIVIAKRETGINNVYVIPEPIIEGTTLHDFMLDEDIDLSDCASIEIHPMANLLIKGELQASSKFGNYTGVEWKKTTKENLEVWVINFDYDLPYNWANLYLYNQGNGEVVETPDIPGIRRAKSAEFEESQSVESNSQLVLNHTM